MRLHHAPARARPDGPPPVKGPSRVCSRVVRAAAGKQNVHVKAAQEQQKDAKPTAADKGFGHAEKKEHSPQQHRVHESSGTGHRFLAWLQENGAPEQLVTLKSVEPPSVYGDTSDPAKHSAPHNRPLDLVVAARPLSPSDVALRIPDNLVISLERVFGSVFVAELLTAGKLSELACLTLFLMYEKKLGTESFWQPYIKELDRQRARGTQAVESPLLWPPAELDSLLQGSPLLAAVKQRLAGIRKEYEELDTVWYMSQSLFSKYPFDLPTETFSFERFTQAFSAVQASIVHLQGVAPSKRFALVPLGPPLLTYSSTSKALIAWDEASRSVQMVVDRAYQEGEPVLAWCGPQPNSRLLLNYGLVDENNPYDKLQITTILGTNDPLFTAKRNVLQARSLSTSQQWDLQRDKPLPPLLLPYIRLAAASTAEQLQQVSFDDPTKTLDTATECKARDHLILHLRARLAAYKHTMEEDTQIMSDSHSSPRQKVASRLLRIEKRILQSALDQLGPSTHTGELQPLPYLQMK